MSVRRPEISLFLHGASYKEDASRCRYSIGGSVMNRFLPTLTECEHAVERLDAALREVRA